MEWRGTGRPFPGCCIQAGWLGLLDIEDPVRASKVETKQILSDERFKILETAPG